MRVLKDLLLYVSVGVLSSVTILAGFGRYDWRLDLLAHWRFHYTMLAVVLLGLLMMRRRYASAVLMTLIVYVNGMVVLNPTAEAATSIAPSVQGRGQRLRLANVNVLYSNNSYTSTLRWLESVEPDVAVVVELTPAWKKAMASLEARLPYAVTVPGSDGEGIALYSRHALEDSQIMHFGESRRAAIAASLTISGRRITIVAAHPLPPRSRWHTRERDGYLRELASFTECIREPVILAGDLNTTPWSYAFKDIARSIGAAGARSPATWPSILGPLGIPIDHVLARGLVIEKTHTGPHIGSDHLPVLTEITVPELI